MSYAPGVDIVCVNYKTPGDLLNFGASLRRHQPQREFSVSIVNVQPGINDAAAADEAVAPLAVVCHLLSFKENVGYGLAANNGALVGNHEVVAVFNADVVLTHDAIDHCCDVLLAHEGWGVAGPRQVDASQRLTAAGIFGTPTAPAHRAWLQPDHGSCRDVRDDCVSVAGSAMFIRRSVWEDLTACDIYRAAAPLDAPVGPLLETPLFYEDTWLCYHARAHGYRLGYIGDTSITHLFHGAINTHGGDHRMPTSKEIFCHACDAHRIDHD